jgi:hypothetical protein
MNLKTTVKLVSLGTFPFFPSSPVPTCSQTQFWLLSTQANIFCTLSSQFHIIKSSEINGQRPNLPVWEKRAKLRNELVASYLWWLLEEAGNVCPFTSILL